jgi:hypothetical protein
VLEDDNFNCNTTFTHKVQGNCRAIPKERKKKAVLKVFFTDSALAEVKEVEDAQ